MVLAFVGGNTAATTMSIAEAAENPQAGQKVQVSGNVVQDSFSTSNDVLTFKIYDPEGDPATQLEVDVYKRQTTAPARGMPFTRCSRPR